MTKSIKYVALFGTPEDADLARKTFAASSKCAARAKHAAYSKKLGMAASYLFSPERHGGVYHNATHAS